MKIVYVLVSDNADYYWEQTYISMMSLLHYNPTANIVLVVDQETHHNLVGNRECIISYANEYYIKAFDSSLSKKIRSRLLKTSIREIVKGDFLYIDCDTVILGELPSIEISCDVAAVYLYHYKELSKSPSYFSVLCEMDACGEQFISEDYFNGGVIYTRDTIIAHQLFAQWHSLYKSFLAEFNIDTDQQSLYVVNNKMNCIIQPLPDEFNFQVGYGMEFISRAIILHYLISTCNGRKIPVHSFQTQEFMVNVRNNIENKDYLIPLIENARLSFLPDVRVTALPLDWSHMINKLRKFATYKHIFLYGQDRQSKMVKFLLKKSNVKVEHILNDVIDKPVLYNKEDVGIIVLCPQDLIEKSIAKLARHGYIHFLPIATDL